MVRCRPLFLLGCTFLLNDCRSLALKAATDVFTQAGNSYGEDEDPQLIEQAAPFALKTMEQLAEADPENAAIRLALASTFAQFTYAFVQQPADFLEDIDITKSEREHLRAKRLYLRARNYALDHLNQLYPGTRAALLGGRREAWQSA